jgi:FRG domain-containing protein
MATIALTLEAYITIVDRAWRGWSKKSDYIADIWYRGHAVSEWTLCPGMYRPPFNAVSEHRYRHEFHLKALPFLAEATTNPVSDWDWYFLMQHHGVPTRLLDWSESALVALYFAVNPQADDKDGAVWILSPRAINEHLTKIGSFIPIYTGASVAPYLKRLWDEAEETIPAHPIAFDPPYNSRRLTAQRGKFTIHGRDQRGLEEYQALKGSLKKIRIPQSAKARLRRQLFAAGITESVLFPGLEGLSREIRDAYAYPWTL